MPDTFESTVPRVMSLRALISVPAAVCHSIWIMQRQPALSFGLTQVRLFRLYVPLKKATSEFRLC